MTPLALLELAGRSSLILVGCEAIWLGIWGALINDQLPQNQQVRDLLPWSRRDRVWLLVFGVGFGSAMIVSGLILPAEQFTSPSFGPFAGFSSLLGVLCAVGIARWTIGELRLAARLRHLRRAHRPEEVDP